MARIKRARIYQDSRQKRKLGSKAPWYVSWDENGRRRFEKVGSKQLAEDIKATKTTAALEKRNGIATDKRWDEFLADYKETTVPLMRSVHSHELVNSVLDRFTKLMTPTFVNGITSHTLKRYAALRLKARGRKPGSTLSPETVLKELRIIRAALGVAAEDDLLVKLPAMPNVGVFTSDKRYVSMAHFEAMLAACDTPGVVKQPRCANAPFDPEDWWKALLIVLWASGMRIGAVLALKWQDVDLEAGTVWSRAEDNKAKEDQRHDLKAAVPFLEKLKGFDPRLFPWDLGREAIYRHFHAIQVAAGIHLPCPGKHTHTDNCHLYGFHDFRRAHATYNYGRVLDRDLQAQMGHSTFATTRKYIKYAEAHIEKTYDAALPKSLAASAG